jgi:hypothetical protein
MVNINSNAGSTASRNTLVKIGVDTSGGTSYVDVIPDLICGGAAPYNVSGGGVWYYFPIFIPAGSRVGAVARGSVTTAIRVGMMAMERPANPSMIRKGSFVESIGISGNTGTSVTSGTTSEGAWTLLGATTLRTWWWQVGMQIATTDTSWSTNSIHVDLAVGDASNKDIIIMDANFTTTTNEQLVNPPLTAGVEWDVPAGTNVYVRAQCSGTADPYEIGAYALGG